MSPLAFRDLQQALPAGDICSLLYRPHCCHISGLAKVMKLCLLPWSENDKHNGHDCPPLYWCACTHELNGAMFPCRIGLRSFGLFDEAQAPAHRAVLVPAPEIVSRKCLSARSTLRQAFVTWRHHVAAQTSIRRRAKDSLGHFFCHPASQICCHIVSGSWLLPVYDVLKSNVSAGSYTDLRDKGHLLSQVMSKQQHCSRVVAPVSTCG